MSLHSGFGYSILGLGRSIFGFRVLRYFLCAFLRADIRVLGLGCSNFNVFDWFLDLVLGF